MTDQQLTAEEIVDLCLRHTLYDWQQQGSTRPMAIASARGSEFFTVDGKRYLDFNSQLMGVNIGHADPRVAEAIAEQARTLAVHQPVHGDRGARAPRPEAGRAAAGRHREVLLHARRRRGQRERDPDREGGHRAATRSSPGTAATTARLRDDHRSRATRVDGATSPGCPASSTSSTRTTACSAGPTTPQTALAHLEETIMLEGPETIAAFILETVTGTNGILIPPDGYLQGVRELCTRHGIVLIADEVMCGFGRTGEWFAVNHWDVVPDIITMAKGLTSSAVPLGAVGISPAIAAYFDDHVFWGGLTYNSHPLALAAALATIAVYEEDGLLEHTRKMGEVMARHHQELMDEAPERRGGSQPRAVRDPRARAEPRDDGADGAVQRDERRDEGGRRVPQRAGSVHDDPDERGHDEPAALHHRGAARRGLRHHRRGARARRRGRPVAPARAVKRDLGEGIELDDDVERIDVDAVHAYLTTAYWSEGRTRESVERLVRDATRVVGLYEGERQVGFCRIVSDGEKFAWLADVYVLEEVRGRGLGVELVREAVEGGPHRELAWYLNTKDAHRLYERFGFGPRTPSA